MQSPAAAATELSIVIPAYREAEKIGDDVAAAGDFLDREFAGAGELIVVDDGSPDDTAARARAATARLPVTVRARVLVANENRGKGAALRLGVAATSGRRVLFADAGGCVPFEDCLRGVAVLDDSREPTRIAHGSRRLPDARIERRPPLYRRIGTRVFRQLVGLWLGVPGHLRDTQCGFKLYDGEVARRLFAASFTDGFMFDIELIRRAHRAGETIREFPVSWRNDHDTRFDPVRGSWRNLRELVQIRRRA